MRHFAISWAFQFVLLTPCLAGDTAGNMPGLYVDALVLPDLPESGLGSKAEIKNIRPTRIATIPRQQDMFSFKIVHDEASVRPFRDKHTALRWHGIFFAPEAGDYAFYVTATWPKFGGLRRLLPLGYFYLKLNDRIVTEKNWQYTSYDALAVSKWFGACHTKRDMLGLAEGGHYGPTTVNTPPREIPLEKGSYKIEIYWADYCVPNYIVRLQVMARGPNDLSMRPIRAGEDVFFKPR